MIWWFRPCAGSPAVPLAHPVCNLPTGNFATPLQPVAQAEPAAAGQGQQAAPVPPAQPQRADAGQRRGDIMAVLPGGQIDIVDVVVTHPVRHGCLRQACTRTGLAAQRAEENKLKAFRRFGDAGQYGFVPFALESYGRLGASAQTFL